MRKSLGSKRKLLSEDQIDEIARQCDAFDDGQRLDQQDFHTTEFGYRRITVERPLRLRFQVTPESLAAYRDTKGSDHADAFARSKARSTTCPRSWTPPN